MKQLKMTRIAKNANIFPEKTFEQAKTAVVQVAIPGNLPEPLWYHVPNDILQTSKVAIGTSVEVPLQSKLVPGICIDTQPTGKSLGFKTKPIAQVFSPEDSFSSEWLELLKWVGNYYHCTLSKVLSAALPKVAIQLLSHPDKRVEASPIKKQKEKSKEVSSKESGNTTKVPPITPHLTIEQSQAVEAVHTESHSFQSFRSFLLHGITGSGKTLVYLHLIKTCLKQGKNALVLLPEISLTPQTHGRFVDFLTSELSDTLENVEQKIHLFHSNLSAKKKKQTWTALIENKVRVLIGVRSAVLAPMENIGLIVVDEEHDGSYKQSESSPRYHARDVALYRGQKLSCPVILGSATPSLESYHSALNQKHYLLKLTERPGAGTPPKVTLVDMKEQWALQGDAPISIPLRDALSRTLESGEQVILLLNRRGYAKRRICENCGNVHECPDCLIPMVPHRKNAQGYSNPQLICHHCSHIEPVNAPCTKCGSQKYLEVGLAIEQLEDKLNQWYPNKNIIRLDRDSTGRIGSLEKLLKTFRDGEADILLGTQMVAKGHDFPNVNLVGIIDGDMGLGLPDFRAQERVFQLAVQVAGRAGRHSDRGHVYIQTYQPDNPTLKQALSDKADAFHRFYSEEVSQREKLFYPPLSKVFKVEFSATQEALVQEQIRRYFQFLKPYADKIHVRLLGPGFASHRKLGGRFRCQIFGKGSSTKQIHWALSESFKEYEGRHKREMQKVRIHVDMDPISVL